MPTLRSSPGAHPGAPARIRIGELEELSHSARDVPPSLLLQALAAVEKALAALAGRITEDDDGDPQPDVDGELLERMYRTLGAGRPLPKR